jgi:hypothetical protein
MAAFGAIFSNRLAAELAARRVLDELETAWRGRGDRMAELLTRPSQPEESQPSIGHRR